MEKLSISFLRAVRWDCKTSYPNVQSTHCIRSVENEINKQNTQFVLWCDAVRHVVQSRSTWTKSLAAIYITVLRCYFNPPVGSHTKIWNKHIFRCENCTWLISWSDQKWAGFGTACVCQYDVCVCIWYRQSFHLSFDKFSAVRTELRCRQLTTTLNINDKWFAYALQPTTDTRWLIGRSHLLWLCVTLCNRIRVMAIGSGDENIHEIVLAFIAHRNWKMVKKRLQPMCVCVEYRNYVCIRFFFGAKLWLMHGVASFSSSSFRQWRHR